MRPAPDMWPRAPRGGSHFVTIRLNKRAAEAVLIAIHSLPQDTLLPDDKDALLEAEVALSRALRPRTRLGAPRRARSAVRDPVTGWPGRQAGGYATPEHAAKWEDGIWT
jgi:hypothetical protein